MLGGGFFNLYLRSLLLRGGTTKGEMGGEEKRKREGKGNEVREGEKGKEGRPEG